MLTFSLCSWSSHKSKRETRCVIKNPKDQGIVKRTDKAKPRPIRGVINALKNIIPDEEKHVQDFLDETKDKLRYRDPSGYTGDLWENLQTFLNAIDKENPKPWRQTAIQVFNNKEDYMYYLR